VLYAQAISQWHGFTVMHTDISNYVSFEIAHNFCIHLQKF